MRRKNKAFTAILLAMITAFTPCMAMAAETEIPSDSETVISEFSEEDAVADLFAGENEEELLTDDVSKQESEPAEDVVFQQGAEQTEIQEEAELRQEETGNETDIVFEPSAAISYHLPYEEGVVKNENFPLTKDTYELPANTKEKIAFKTPETYKREGMTVKYETSNSAVATITKDGEIQAYKEGNTYATFSFSHKMGENVSLGSVQFLIRVTKENTEIALPDKEITLQAGKYQKLIPQITPDNLIVQKEIKWYTSNPAVATVKTDGTVTALKKGQTIITAEIDNAGTKKRAATKVNVINMPASAITVNPVSLVLDKGEQKTLTIKTYPEEADKEITWSSSDESVASVFGGLVTAKGHGEAVITATAVTGGATASCKVIVKPETSEDEQSSIVPTDNKTPSVLYKTHVQTYGWEKDFVLNGAKSGTSGESKRLEGIQIKMRDIEKWKTSGVQYRTHVQTYGWENTWRKDGETSGTTGQSKRLEAIQIQLYGEIANEYDIWYRVHSQTYGWLGWTKNGAPAGTEGFSKRLEAIQIKVQKKGSAAPGNTENPYIRPMVLYQTHSQTIGWQPAVHDTMLAGTTGQSKRMEAIKISLGVQDYRGDIEYCAHVQKYGWMNWVKNGDIAGTTGEAKRMEAIRIRLTSEMASHYDVYYQTHIQHFGWTDWARNGEMCGSAGYGYRLEGIRIAVLPKGTGFPVATQPVFYEK